MKYSRKWKRTLLYIPINLQMILLFFFFLELQNDENTKIVVLEHYQVLSDGTLSRIDIEENDEIEIEVTSERDEEYEEIKNAASIVEISEVEMKVASKRNMEYKEIENAERIVENNEVEIEIASERDEECKDNENAASIVENNEVKVEIGPVKRELENKKKIFRKRLKGKPYIGYKRGKENIVTHNTDRKARSIRQRCSHVTEIAKVKEKSFRCSLITDAERQSLFKKYWALPTWNDKKKFVQNLARKRALRRRRKEIQDSERTPKKKYGHDYFLVNKNREHLKVCRVMVLNTLDLGEDSMKRWTNTDVISPGSTTSDESPANNKQLKNITSRKTKQMEKKQM